MTFRSTMIVAACLAGLAPIQARANAIQAFATGNLRVNPTTNEGLAAKATGEVCGYAEVGGVRALKAQRLFFGGNPGKEDDCFISFATEPLKSNVGTLAGRGFSAPKFPPPQPGTGSNDAVDVHKVAANSTDSFGSAEWKASESLLRIVDGIDITFVIGRTSLLTATANVVNTGPKPPGGTAAAEALDPWFFTPDVDTMLSLQVSLEDVHLLAESDAQGGAIAQLETFGLFGFGSQVGDNVMASWNFSQSVLDNGSFDLASDMLLNMSIPLAGGNTYWMTDTLRAGAVAPVSTSEPSTIWLMLFGAVGVVLSNLFNTISIKREQNGSLRSSSLARAWRRSAIRRFAFHRKAA
jgi:hypothetical protein